MSFKIIGIEVLDSCKSEHSKNLRKNFPYIFYKNYKIKKEDGKEVIKLVSEDFDLYSKDNKININISAIVGKNGSGKSTLVELFIKTINNLFYKYSKDPNYNFHPVRNVTGIEVNIYYKINTEVFKLYVFSNKGKENCLYKIYQYTFKESLREYKDIQDITSFFNLKDFFYTEVINYSLYAYNPKQDGEWITKIFHKNDAYQTPVVLNPYRERGNIDINIENDLVFQRLLANLLRYNSNKKLNLNLGDNLEASFLLLELSSPEYYKEKSEKDFDIILSDFDDNYKDKILDSLLSQFHEKTLKIKADNKLLDLSKLYILYKLISICNKYEEYKNEKYFDTNTKNFIDLQGLIKRLKEDNSHITFKLRQTLNYLIHQHIKFDTTKTINKLEFKIVAQEIKKVVDREECNIINCLPPPIFKIDIELISNKSGENNIKFNTLSSGEKQQIYSINSIYYHLTNLNSVKNSTDEKKVSYKVYQYNFRRN